jgi:hypothetical protein
MITRTDIIQDAFTIGKVEEATEKVTKFMAKVLPRMERDGDKVVEVYQLGSGMEDPIAAFEFGLGDSPEEIAAEIMNEASQDAEGIGAGAIRYVVRIQGFGARCAFTLTVKPGGDDDEEDFIDDLPNHKGMTAQQMRHNEKLLKTTLGMAKEMKEMAMGMMKQRDERIKDLEGSQVNVVRMFEDLSIARHVRDLEVRKLEAKERRGEQVAGMLMQGLPIILSKFGPPGAGDPPQSAGPMTGPKPLAPSPVESMVEGFMSSLNSEQFNKIVESGVFTPMQIMTLVEIARSIKAKEEADQGDAGTMNGQGEEAKKQDNPQSA